MNWQRNPAVVWEDDGRAIWAAHPAVGELVKIDGVGAVIWDWLDEPFDALVAELAAGSGESPDTIARDVTAYLVELEKVKLVQRV